MSGIWARELFRLGDRIELSPEGRRAFPRLHGQVRQVVGFSRDPELIRIVKPGSSYTCNQCYNARFWQKAQAGVE